MTSGVRARRGARTDRRVRDAIHAAGDATSDASGAVSVELVQSVVHQSLVRPQLYLGVERHVVALEATLCAALLFAARPSVLSVGAIAIVLLVIHPTFAWLTNAEPMVTELYLRHASYAEYYAPRATLAGRHRVPQVSIPASR